MTLSWLRCKACIGHRLNSLSLFPLRHLDSLSNVQESVWQQENGLWSERGPVSISLRLCLTPSSERKKWKSISNAVMNGATFLISLPHTCCVFSPFLFSTTKVKGQRTGRSQYSCGTRSAATGWETTSISTCSSAPRRVGTGGSTRPTKSPLTVRPHSFSFLL